MKYVLKLLLWAVGIIAALLLTIVALQIFYRLTPVALSDEAKALLEETKHMAHLTENGYRFLGLHAPIESDPVVYGECVVTAKKSIAYARRVPLNQEEVQDAVDAENALISKECDRGRKPLANLHPPPNEDQVQPSFDWARLVSYADKPIAPIYRERWDAVLIAGQRGNEPNPLLGVFPHYSSGVRIEAARRAEFARDWARAKGESEKLDAIESIARSIERNADFANGTLLDAMIANAVLSSHLLVLQRAASAEPMLSRRVADAMLAVTKPIDRFQLAIEYAIGAEFRAHVALANQMKNFSGAEGISNRLFDRLDAISFDVNDTLNASAAYYLSAKRSALDPEQVALAPAHAHEPSTCSALGALNWICLLFQRNALGRMTVTMAMPSYRDYGGRTYDIRTLAAATRLTIEARARGLQGEQLAAFIANAPADMRDAARGEPFAYNAQTKLLTIKLQTKSSVLGEKSYNLPL
jgi:hypothetical protein